MAELATLARPYAKAVFEVARNDGELERWSRMLALLAAALEHDRIRTLLGAPEVEDTVKAHKLAGLCAGELSDRGRRFLLVLAGYHRLALLPEIQEQFEALRAEEQATLDVQVTSAFDLSGDELDRLKSALARRFEREISISAEVDASLIGGAVIRAGDTVIDGSVRGRLNKLAETIQRS